MLRRAQLLLAAAQLPSIHLDNRCAIDNLDYALLCKVDHVLAPTSNRLLNDSLLPCVVPWKTCEHCAANQRIMIKVWRLATRWRPQPLRASQPYPGLQITVRQ